MWQAEIVADIQRNTAPTNGGLSNLTLQNIYRFFEDVKLPLVDGLLKSKCFHVGTLDLTANILDQVEKDAEKTQEFYDYENMHMPYAYTLWEYEISEYGIHGNKKEALFVIDSDGVVCIYPVSFLEELQVWITGLFYVVVKKDTRGTICIYAPKDTNDIARETIEAAARRVVSYVLSFLKILACKNITTQEIKPKITRQMKRHGTDKDLYSYHVLTIKPLASKARGVAVDGDPQDHNRVHFCRGHFKQYFPDKPLFGKFTGLYWWEPHLRGQDRSGFVDKDYEIVTEEAVTCPIDTVA